MIVQVEGNRVTIRGKNVGDKRFISIVVSEDGGKDRFSTCIHDNPFELGGIEPIIMDKDFIIKGKEIIR